MEDIKKLTGAISIIGNIKNRNDIGNIKVSIASYNLKDGDAFTIEVKDSFAMPSAMIGYLMQLVEQDKIRLSLKVGNEKLAELLDDLGLSQVFNIKTIRFA
jgi:hypothetical protein